MSHYAKPKAEFITQRKVIDFFEEILGYTYLGNWKDRPGNSHIEEELLKSWLNKRGHGGRLIEQALRHLHQAATLIGGSKNLYNANQEVYRLLRYGVKVLPAVGEQHHTLWLIDWKKPENNDFAIAEEVTVSGNRTKRPDLVLYVNGIALGVIELKRSGVSITEGIRQNLDNQKTEFIQSFFTGIQLVMVGNESQGLRYATIGTPEKYWLRWKESVADPRCEDNSLLKELWQLCRKERLLELIHDFVVYDAGTKKVCRHNQYFGVKAAQEYAKRKHGGIIWHTQGSGKSLTMVWLARWIRENIENSRVLLITDRTELDEQIEKVFHGVNEDIYRTKSGSDLVRVLSSPENWLLCSLIHKFGRSDELSAEDIEAYVEEIKKNLPPSFRPAGNFFVFVDECHRTQSGKLHRAMKTLLPDAVFIGFTGTPLLKKDKATSIEIFGPYIHTYKYDEAVRDGVVLDLLYEARDIDQAITSQERVDEWFESKTRGLQDFAKAQLKERWGTMKKILSAQDRLRKIVADISLDMVRKPRLMDGHGNALLVTDSIYNACRVYGMFQETDLRGKCAIVTSYRPSPNDIKGEESGEGLTEKLIQYDIYRKMLADWFEEDEEKAMYKIERFEQEVKKRFIEEPGQMKLLIVVDKLLTGFDAPSATYLYIDKQIRDHGLFQAICRVNRLHTEDKEYGYIIDYRDLFKSVAKAIADYTGEAFDGYAREDVDGLLKNRLQKGRERLDQLRESLKALCEPVALPKDESAYLHYFVTEDSGDAEQIRANEAKRHEFYKLVGSLIRAYTDLANELPEAGYSQEEIEKLREEVRHFTAMKDTVRIAAGEYIDLKQYEPAMRQLMDTYIRAEESEKLVSFDDIPLVDLLVDKSEATLDSLKTRMNGNNDAMAETIENNVRKLIIDKTAVNPAYYEKMSKLLDDLIERRRKEMIEYKAYLKKIIELAAQVKQPEKSKKYPKGIDTPARQALFDNLLPILNAQQAQDLETMTYSSSKPDFDIFALSLKIDEAIRQSGQDGWRGNNFKTRLVRKAIEEVLPWKNELAIQRIMEIVSQQNEY